MTFKKLATEYASFDLEGMQEMANILKDHCQIHDYPLAD